MSTSPSRCTFSRIGPVGTILWGMGPFDQLDLSQGLEIAEQVPQILVRASMLRCAGAGSGFVHIVASLATAKDVWTRPIPAAAADAINAGITARKNMFSAEMSSCSRMRARAGPTIERIRPIPVAQPTPVDA